MKESTNVNFKKFLFCNDFFTNNFLTIAFFIAYNNYEVGMQIVGSYQNKHLWNGVYYEGEYLLIDCTCGSGYFQNKKQFINKPI